VFDDNVAELFEIEGVVFASVVRVEGRRIDHGRKEEVDVVVSDVVVAT
jgi:hypothetical protein